MMSTIKWYTGANQIHKFKSQWEQDSQKLKTLLDQANVSIEKYENILNENNLNENFEFIEVSINNLRESLEYLPIYNRNNNVLYSFVWDCQTPFFSAAVDSLIPKFETLKETLFIENGDTIRLENARSSKAYSPIRGTQLPYFNKDIDLFKPGQYIHMCNRPKAAHIGLLVTKPHHEKTIETNPLGQWTIENYMDSDSREKVRKSDKMVNMLMNDTVINRVKAFKQSFYDMLHKILSYPQDSINGGQYTNIFIFLNPIMSGEDSYIDAIKTVGKELCQFILSKKLFEEADIQTPKFTLVLLSSSNGFSCPNFFSPSKSTGTKTKDLVID